MVFVPILDKYGLFTRSEKAIADFILSHPEQALLKNAYEIAKLSGTSPATVGRFARKIGFESFTDVKISMAKQASSDTDMGKSLFITKDDPYELCADKLMSQIEDACRSTSKSMDYAALSEAIERILHSKNIYIAGVGASGVIAMDLQLKLTRLKLKATYAQDPHVSLLNIMTAKPDDVVVIISYSGETQVIIETLHAAKETGAYTLAIAGSKNTTLSKEADAVLTSPAIEQTIRISALSSHYSQQFVCDMIFLGLLTKTFDEAENLISTTSKKLEKIR